MPTLFCCADETEIQGEVSSTTIPFDYLVYAVGAETQTFGIPGVKEHACFMKEIQDAEKASSHLLGYKGNHSNRIPVQASIYGLYVIARWFSY
jgi:NADH dehydrogenase FAD-containing subunit